MWLWSEFFVFCMLGKSNCWLGRFIEWNLVVCCGSCFIWWWCGFWRSWWWMIVLCWGCIYSCLWGCIFVGIVFCIFRSCWRNICFRWVVGIMWWGGFVLCIMRLIGGWGRSCLIVIILGIFMIVGVGMMGRGRRRRGMVVRKGGGGMRLRLGRGLVWRGRRGWLGGVE